MLMSVCTKPQTVNRFVKIQLAVLNVVAVKVSTCNQMGNLVKVSEACTVRRSMQPSSSYVKCLCNKTH